MGTKEVLALLKKRNVRVANSFHLFQEDLAELLKMVNSLNIEETDDKETKQETVQDAKKVVQLPPRDELSGDKV